MLKLGLVTSTRAEYGLLLPLIKKMRDDCYFDLDVIVTGTHLLKKHGYTVDYIRQDGIKINHEINIFGDGDTQYDICKNISNGVDAFSKLFQDNIYDGIIVLGDRYELWSICIPAVINNIPIIHIGGGEATYGAIDEYVRHSVTKMASIHFPSIDLYRQRIIQMGENPNFVFSVGALGIDNVKMTKLIPKDELYKLLGLNNFDKYVLVTYHPVTLEDNKDVKEQINSLLDALVDIDFVSVITMPNADTGRDAIASAISEYVNAFPDKIKAFESLGQSRYLSAMTHASIMIGNSSSGILESFAFKVPVVNIGLRQEGRFRTKNIIDCQCTKEYIIEAVNKANDDEFRKSFVYYENPYGDGDAADKIIDVLKNINFNEKKTLILKEFHKVSF